MKKMKKLNQDIKRLIKKAYKDGAKKANKSNGCMGYRSKEDENGTIEIERRYYD